MADLTQDNKWMRKAADSFIQAAKMGLENGRIRYTLEISQSLVTLNDKKSLDDIFGKMIAAPKEMDRNYYYLAMVHYADGLAKLNDEERAWVLFEEAIKFHPENNTEAVNRYTRHLLDKGNAKKALKILDSLTSDQRIWDVNPAYYRKEALLKLGLDSSSADKELEMIKIHLTAGNDSRSYVIFSEESLIENKISSVEQWGHFEPSDDCRSQALDCCFQGDFNCPYLLCPSYSQGMGYPYVSGWYKWIAHGINLAEIIYNEAGGESKGAQDMVGWTVKNRAFESLSCDYYPGQNTACNTPCLWCESCVDSTKYCCAMHGGTTNVGDCQSQFNDSHRDCETLYFSGVIWEAEYVNCGQVPDMSNPTWIPPGFSSCDYNCTRPKCLPLTNRSIAPSPSGPMEFKSIPNPSPPKGKESQYTCKWYSGNVCNDGAPDNYFWNRDACNGHDRDRDGVCDEDENCPNTCNPWQLNADGDGKGDVCDNNPGCGGCGQPQCDPGC